MGVFPPNASVRTDIFVLGALESSLAQDVMVAPVVVTSSTSRMCLFEILSLFFSWKMSDTFFLLSKELFMFVCDGLLVILFTTLLYIGIPVVLLIPF